MPLPLDIIIARWVSILWLVGGLSHLLHPAQWAVFLKSLREGATSSFLLAAFNFPMGLMVVLAHNVWVWDLPVIITVAGWMTTIKSVIYLLLPGAFAQVTSTLTQPERAFRIAGVVLIVLGAVAGYDAFLRR